jgi:peptidoglycan/xylan/chitin deacetylase (PgdA/CDA1 family)
MRLDRAISLIIMSTELHATKQRTVPILMYHSISDNSDEDLHPYYRTNTSPGRFREQMCFLYENGYSAIDLDEAVNRLSAHSRMAKSVVITFDDGYLDFYTNAWPVLQSYLFPATVFLPTKFIGKSRQQFKNRDTLTWSEVRKLQAAGVSFGSHTVSHPQLRDLPASEVESELRTSKSVLERELGTAIRSFAYPYAFPEQDKEFASNFRRGLRIAGYTIGVSTVLGTARQSTDPLLLPRLPVNSEDDQALFRAKLSGAYDWLHVPQYWHKCLMRRRSRNSQQSIV